MFPATQRRGTVFRFWFPPDEFPPSWVGFTPDGKRLAAVEHDGKVMAWDFVPVAP